MVTELHHYLDSIRCNLRLDPSSEQEVTGELNQKTRDGIRPFMITRVAIITDTTICIPQEQDAF